MTRARLRVDQIFHLARRGHTVVVFDHVVDGPVGPGSVLIATGDLSVRSTVLGVDLACSPGGRSAPGSLPLRVEPFLPDAFVRTAEFHVVDTRRLRAAIEAYLEGDASTDGLDEIETVVGEDHAGTLLETTMLAFAEGARAAGPRSATRAAARRTLERAAHVLDGYAAQPADDVPPPR